MGTHLRTGKPSDARTRNLAGAASQWSLLMLVQTMRVVLQVMATACLFLACKVQEAPKALKDVMLCMWTMKYRGRVAELDRIKDRVHCGCDM